MAGAEAEGARADVEGRMGPSASGEIDAPLAEDDELKAEGADTDREALETLEEVGAAEAVALAPATIQVGKTEGAEVPELSGSVWPSKGRKGSMTFEIS